MTDRIVSLLPSATEILFWLGAGERVVGVTYECNEPPEAAALPHLTNTIIPTGATPGEIDAVIKAAVEAGNQLYSLDEDLLRRLDPDMIVTQDLCRVCALPSGDVDAALKSLGSDAEVFSYDPMTLDEVLTQIEALAVSIGAPHQSRVEDLRRRLATQRDSAAAIQAKPRVLLLEWVDPPFTPGHWIPDQISAAGGEPVLAHPGARSQGCSWETIAQSEADVILLAPCGFTFDQATEQMHAVWDRPELKDLPAVRNRRVFALDGDAYVVRPGPRLIDGIDKMRELIR